MPEVTRPESPDDRLTIRGLTIAFGGVRAVNGLDLDVPPGSILSLIGPNGAGKTTVLNSISGFVRASGSVRYRNIELLGMAPYRRAGLGIGRTFQNLQLFTDMSLQDNVLTGFHTHMGGNVLFDMVRLPVLRAEKRVREEALDILRQLSLDDYAGRPAGSLPFGVQKLAGVARALAVRPTLLLMDEPAAGLNPTEAEEFGTLIVRLRRDLGITIVLVEHNMRLVMRISDHVVVLEGGRKLVEGSADEVRTNPAVIAAYLGESGGVAREVLAHEPTADS